VDRLRFGELDVDDDAERGRALLDLKEVLVLLLQLLRTVLVLDGHQLQRYLVGRVDARRPPGVRNPE
jgi:hypothetical protein